MPKAEPSTYLEALDVEGWKQAIQRHEEREEYHWATLKKASLVRALTERMASEPQAQFVGNQEKQRELVERELGRERKRLRLIK